MGWENTLEQTTPEINLVPPEGSEAGNTADFMGRALSSEVFGQMKPGKTPGLSFD